jgi:hypothetical protein
MDKHPRRDRSDFGRLHDPLSYRNLASVHLIAGGDRP